MHHNDRLVALCLLTVGILAVGVIALVGGRFRFDSHPEAPTSPASSAPAARETIVPIDAGIAPQKVVLRAFDPNTADSTVLLALGLSRWQVRNIYRYRVSGGVYSRPEDFARLYGLTQKKYRELLPYIRISADYRPAAELVGSYRGPSVSPAERGSHVLTASGDTLRHSNKLHPGETISLNEADTALLQRVPGVGSGYSRAIYNYRQRLGGFARVDQLLEISGFPESALPYFRVSAGEVRRLRINSLSVSKLRQHPYINFYMAKAIVDQRRLAGPIHSLQQLRNLPDFTPEVIARLEPYVEY